MPRFTLREALDALQIIHSRLETATVIPRVPQRVRELMQEAIDEARRVLIRNGRLP